MDVEKPNGGAPFVMELGLKRARKRDENGVDRRDAGRFIRVNGTQRNRDAARLLSPDLLDLCWLSPGRNAAHSICREVSRVQWPVESHTLVFAGDIFVSSTRNARLAVNETSGTPPIHPRTRSPGDNVRR